VIGALGIPTGDGLKIGGGRAKGVFFASVL
jgi:hypothetical protein